MNENENIVVEAPKAKRASISPQDFIRACVAAEKDGDYTAERVAEMTGLKVASVRAKVANYRKEYGINLKEFPAGERGNHIDRDALKDLLADLRGE